MAVSSVRAASSLGVIPPIRLMWWSVATVVLLVMVEWRSGSLSNAVRRMVAEDRPFSADDAQHRGQLGVEDDAAFFGGLLVGFLVGVESRTSWMSRSPEPSPARLWRATKQRFDLL